MRYFDNPDNNKISMSITYRVSNITGISSINYLEYKQSTTQNSYSALMIPPKIEGSFTLCKEIKETELLPSNINVDIISLEKPNIYFKLVNVKVLKIENLKCTFVSYKEPIISSKEIFRASNGGETLHKGEIYSIYNDSWNWY
jgi:hypothetical protein